LPSFDYDKLVGSIYDCAANPELWPDTLNQVCNTIGGAYTWLGLADLSEMSSGRMIMFTRFNSTWDEGWLQKLDAALPTMLTSTPVISGMMDTGLDQSWTQLSRTSEAEFQKSEFYNMWVKPQGLRDSMNVPFLQRAKIFGMISIPSPASRRPYSARDCRLIERLSPHIWRAMVINDIIDKGKLAQSLFRHVLDELSVAVFVVKSGGNLVFCNASGEQMLVEGNFLKFTNGHLAAQTANGSGATFIDAIDRASLGDVAIGLSGIGVPLIDMNGERAAAYMLPIVGNDLRGAIGQGHCAVFVAKRGEQQPMVDEILRSMFDLTIAEVRIAILIGKGDSPKMIAIALGISVNTVRSHLQSVFAKSRCENQNALAALVNGLMPPLT
jgi:DNA-binding CsgD family transcriptional regulator